MCYVIPILSPFLFIQSLYASFLKFIGFFTYLYIYLFEFFHPIFTEVVAYSWQSFLPSIQGVIDIFALCCPTRWTVRAGAIDAILKNYCVLIETSEEIHETTRDEYGLKARGFLHSLESFSTLLGLQLSHKLFSVAEQVSLVLPKKSLTIQDALSAVDTAKAYYSCIQTDDEFNHFYI